MSDSQNDFGLAPSIHFRDLKNLSFEFVFDMRSDRMSPIQAYFPDSKIVAANDLDHFLELAEPKSQTRVLVLCDVGQRSLQIVNQMRGMAFQESFSLHKGALALVRSELDLADIKRYQAHVNLPFYGVDGHKKISNLKVLVVGCGGVASPLLIQLAGSGVGCLGLVDDDVVELSNLPRQYLHRESSLGENKARSAAIFLRELNSNCKVKEYPNRLNFENVDQIISDYDLIVDASDNFPTRYLLAQAAHKNQRVVFHASILMEEAQLMIFDSHNGPCLFCAYPEIPPVEMNLACSVVGAFGPTISVISSLLAGELIKFGITGGREKFDRIWRFSSTDFCLESFVVKKNSDCVCCSKPAKNYDYIQNGFT